MATDLVRSRHFVNKLGHFTALKPISSVPSGSLWEDKASATQKASGCLVVQPDIFFSTYDVPGNVPGARKVKTDGSCPACQRIL